MDCSCFHVFIFIPYKISGTETRDFTDYCNSQTSRVLNINLWFFFLARFHKINFPIIILFLLPLPSPAQPQCGQWPAGKQLAWEQLTHQDGLFQTVPLAGWIAGSTHTSHDLGLREGKERERGGEEGRKEREREREDENVILFLVHRLTSSQISGDDVHQCLLPGVQHMQSKLIYQCVYATN